MRRVGIIILGSWQKVFPEGLISHQDLSPTNSKLSASILTVEKINVLIMRLSTRRVEKGCVKKKRLDDRKTFTILV